MADNTGLRNRGNGKADADERRKAVEKIAGVKLDAISSYPFDAELASKNIENMIGAVHVPLGFAGPVLIHGDHAKGEFLVPLATTEGALVASVSRGMSAVTASGGVRTKVIKDEMTRAPVFRVSGIEHSLDVIDWMSKNEKKMKDAVRGTTSHGKLISAEPFPNGRSLFIRFSYGTGDAMGMNMVTIASEALCALIEKETGAVLISVSGNMCTDKKPAWINAIEGRGKTVIAEALIPPDVVKNKLRTSVDAITETNVRKNLIGSSMAGSMGHNAHAANMAAALYIATGQDPAQVVEASMAMTACEPAADGSLYISVRMPSIEVGTVGGGTGLPAQSESLRMIGCAGTGKAKKLAEIVAATVLAGELSTLAAQSAGHLGKAHKELGR